MIVFRFFQIRGYIEQLKKLNRQGQLDNILLKVFTDAYVLTNNQKNISKFYRGLQQTKCNTLYVKQNWEREGNLPLGEEDWENLCETQWKTSSSNIWREICWKNLIRYLFTPAQRSHYTNSLACWRQCGYTRKLITITYPGLVHC